MSKTTFKCEAIINFLWQLISFPQRFKILFIVSKIPTNQLLAVGKSNLFKLFELIQKYFNSND